MLLSRRTLLTAASLSAIPRPAWAQGFSRGFFTHGVASGDPLQDRVIIWTRFVPAGANGRIGWEVSEDESFARVVRNGVVEPSFASDFCVHIDVVGLQPGRRYFYRFLSGGDPSPTGMTRTAPTQAERVSFALCSCANLPYGYFHAYKDMIARDDIEFLLHLGDYIYEIKRGAYPDENEIVPGRDPEPWNDTVTLGDYYQRYDCYHRDADLQELRRLKPLCVIWDDHEIANDAWREGAGAHNPETQGAYADRVAAADKAFHDWVPVRRFTTPRYRQYRSFDWGLARFILLDTRFIGRDRQLDYRTFTNRLAEAGADAQALLAQYRREELDNPNRALLGADQERWLNETMADSKSRDQPWQLIAQQIIVGEQKFGPGIEALLPTSASAGTHEWVQRNTRLAELGISWNSDAWGGYGASRQRFLDGCVTNANNALVLAGDSHNCWMNNLPGSGRRAGVEFATGSVSPPGLERTFTGGGNGEREALFRSANPDTAYLDMRRRGYGAVTLTREGCTADWVAVSDTRNPVAGASQRTRFEAAAGASAGPGAWTQTG